MKGKTLSIITVSYNAANTIEDTILSVIQQTYNNIEFIIIDGNSQDGTINIIKKYESKISYWISEPDKGIYDAMNKGLGIANGEYVLFLGADDKLFSQDTIEKIVPNLKDDQIYYGDCYITQIRKIYWGKFNKYKLSIGNICHQAIFYPKIVYKTKKYKTEYKIYADYVYNIELFSNYPFTYLNETISIFNYNGISSSQKDLYFIKNQYRIIQKELGILPVVLRFTFQLIRDIKHLIIPHKYENIKVTIQNWRID